MSSKIASIKIQPFKHGLLFIFIMLPPSVIAADLNPADANIQEQIRQQERQRLLRQQLEIKPDVHNAAEKIKSAASASTDDIPDHESPCFTLSKIELTGDSAHQFQFALDKVLAHSHSSKVQNKAILGSCLGAIGINAVMARVQNGIIAKGFVTTRVLAAPQDLKTGILQLTIIPGRVHAIRFTSDSSQRVSAWNALPAGKGDILNLRDIEQGLENLKRVPSAEADIQIEPAFADPDHAPSATPLPAQPGLSDLVIRYHQRLPIRVSFTLDDSGSSSTGKYQGGITLSGDNLLALNDLFYVNFNHDLGGGIPGGRGNSGYSAHYSIPWGYYLLSSTTSSNDFHQTVAGASQNYVFSGHSQNAEVKISRLLFRNSLNKTSASLKGFFRKSSNFIDDTEIEVQRRRTAGWELGLNQSWFLGKAVLDYNLAYKRGTGAQHALKAPEESFGEGTSRMAMLIGDLNLGVPWEIKTPWGKQTLQYSANLRGQTNFTPLTPQDRFSIGSRFTVRGFDGQQTLIADNGWLLRNELMVPIAQFGQALYWGLDYGVVDGQSSASLAGKHLAGTVIGLRGNGQASGSRWLSGFYYDVFIGKPISKPAGFATSDSSAGFNLSWSY